MSGLRVLVKRARSDTAVVAVGQAWRRCFARAVGRFRRDKERFGVEGYLLKVVDMHIATAAVAGVEVAADRHIDDWAVAGCSAAAD